MYRTVPCCIVKLREHDLQKFEGYVLILPCVCNLKSVQAYKSPWYGSHDVYNSSTSYPFNARFHMSRYEILPINDSDSLKLAPSVSFKGLRFEIRKILVESVTHLLLTNDQETISLYLPVRVEVNTTTDQSAVQVYLVVAVLFAPCDTNKMPETIVYYDVSDGICSVNIKDESTNVKLISEVKLDWLLTRYSPLK